MPRVSDAELEEALRDIMNDKEIHPTPATLARHARTLLPALIEEVRELRRMVGEVAGSGVEFEDPRIRYLTVQIDQKLWAELKRPGRSPMPRNEVRIEGWVRDPRPTYCMTVYTHKRDAASTGVIPTRCTLIVHAAKDVRRK